MRYQSPSAMLASIAALIFALVALPTVTMAQSINDIISRGKLIVAIDTTTPPYGFLDEKLEPTGFDIDVAKKRVKPSAFLWNSSP